jgi:hypothetical protein
MRFDLKVPFADKDTAKRLGARWDAARKIWYVVDKGGMAPFSNWSPTPHDETSAAPAPKKSTPAKTEATGNVYVGSEYVAHPRVCECPPWEVCNKCRATAFLPK